MKAIAVLCTVLCSVASLSLATPTTPIDEISATITKITDDMSGVPTQFPRQLMELYEGVEHIYGTNTIDTTGCPRWDSDSSTTTSSTSWSTSTSYTSSTSSPYTSSTSSSYSSSTSTTTSVPTGSGVPLYGQCGGVGWTGPTTCAPPNVCTDLNEYYSQCLP